MGQDSPINIAADRYQIEGEIGRGGMGVVLKAHDKLLDIPVAIKILPLDSSGLGAARLQREATAAGSLSHPNIAKILDFGRTADTPYMVMEYVDGESLDLVIKTKSKIECQQALLIFHQIALALGYAHAHGVIHRDLKPANVMLCTLDSITPQIKILDFGIAKIFNDDQGLTKTGAIVGSPQYMSPEQILGEEITTKSDIYSFGCLMFEALTGQVPFKGASVLETLSKHRNVAPPLVTELISAHKFPKDLVELVDECLRKSPVDRPDDFQTIAARLQMIQKKMDSAAVSPELIQKISRQYLRIKLIRFWKSKFGAIIVISAMILILGLGASMYHSEQERLQEVSAVPKRSMIENPLLKEENKLVTHRGAIGKGFDYTPTTEGIEVSSDDSIGDNDLILLRNKKIIAAYLDHGAFDGSGLQYLNPQILKTLSIKNSGVTDNNTQFLTSMKNLQTLRLGSPVLSDACLKNISSLPNITSLSLSSNAISDKGLELISNLPLNELTISSSSITGNIISTLKKTKNLNKLELISTSIDADFGAKIADLKDLEDLNLSGSKNLSAKSFASLHKLKLKSLKLDDTILGAGSLEQISRIKTIKTLVLGSSRFAPDSISSLQNSPNLKRLDFVNSKSISDELINNLEKLKQLKVLIFNNTNISERQVLKLSKLRNLERLELFETNIDETSHQIFKDTFKRIWKRDCTIEGSMRF